MRVVPNIIILEFSVLLKNCVHLFVDYNLSLFARIRLPLFELDALLSEFVDLRKGLILGEVHIPKLYMRDFLRLDILVQFGAQLL